MKPAVTTVTLELDPEEFALLLNQWEGVFRCGGDRGDPKALSYELNQAAKSWSPTEPSNAFEYDIIRFMPAYCRMVKLWRQITTEEIDTGQDSRDVDNVFEFVTALREARSAVAAMEADDR